MRHKQLNSTSGKALVKRAKDILGTQRKVSEVLEGIGTGLHFDSSPQIWHQFGIDDLGFHSDIHYFLEIYLEISLSKKYSL